LTEHTPTSQEPTAEELRAILGDTRTVAVVGVSDNPARPSNDVFAYLARHSDYRLFPVNPAITEVGGIPAYPSLAALPEVPDMVDVFRRHEELPGVLADVLALTPRPKYLWLQQGLRHDTVAQAAREAGMTVVMDRCLKVDHARFSAR
jgi:predicted CoA-binding protein